MKIPAGQVTETVAPTTEPVTTAQAKSHLRVDISDDDTYIGTLITAARVAAENWCQRSIAQHTYRADFADFADTMCLPFGPVQSVSSVKYYNTDSPTVLTTLSSGVYTLFYDEVRRNWAASWESVYPRPDAVQITYTTGYSDLASPEDTVANVPKPIYHAILMLVADYYENREAQFVGFSVIQENMAVQRLLAPYRIYR